MNFGFHPKADGDLDEAVKYYEERQCGLGLAFAEEVYQAIRRACEYPDAWPKVSCNARRCLLNRFPYSVIFQVKADKFRVIAIANQHRHPDYWQNRNVKESV